MTRIPGLFTIHVSIPYDDNGHTAVMKYNHDGGDELPSVTSPRSVVSKALGIIRESLSASASTSTEPGSTSSLSPMRELTQKEWTFTLTTSQTIMDRALTIISFNLHGFSQGSSTVRDLITLNAPDVICIQ